MEKANTENVTPRTAARWGLIVALLTIPVAIAVDHFAPGKGTPVGVSLALLIGAIRVFWYLRKQPWFWMAIAALMFIHALLIVVVPWSNKSFPAPELWPIGIVDFAAICGFVKLIEKAMTQGDAAERPTS